MMVVSFIGLVQPWAINLQLNDFGCGGERERSSYNLSNVSDFLHPVGTHILYLHNIQIHNYYKTCLFISWSVDFLFCHL